MRTDEIDILDLPTAEEDDSPRGWDERDRADRVSTVSHWSANTAHPSLVPAFLAPVALAADGLPRRSGTRRRRTRVR